jgi:GH24 family phage-related lysozyme (muramidase)
MKGISKIKGNIIPKVGETNTYELDEVHHGTIIADYNTIKWKVYQFKDGQWLDLEGPAKTGKSVTFNFPQKWYGKKLLIEAYIYTAEAKAPPGLVVTPVLGAKKILNSEILDANENPITTPRKYGQSISLKVTTQNMLGEIMKLSLWERDTISDKGHDPVNNIKLWEGNAKLPDNKGVSITKIMLSTSMMMDANKSMFEGSEHEYYLLVDAGKQRQISKTTQVSSEILLTKDYKKRPDPKPVVVKEEPNILKQIPVKVKNDVGFDTPVVEGVSKAVIQDPKAPKVQGILTAYFAKEEFTKETDEVAGQHQYTFKNDNNDIDKEKVAGIIKKNVDAVVKGDKKYCKQDYIRYALTQTSYKKGATIKFDLYKLGASYKRINSAPLEEEVYVVANTYLLNGQEATITIKEKDALLVAADGDLTVLEAKENGAEITTLKATVEDGIAKVKIKLRPKSDEDLKTWKEKLAHGKEDGTHRYLVERGFTVEGDLEAIAASIEKKSNKALTNHIVKKADIAKELKEGNFYVSGKNFEFPKYKKEVPVENLWLKVACRGAKKYEEEFLKKDGEYFILGKSKEIIFPLLVKPENDIGNKWYNSYNWAAAQGNNMATFNTTRSGNKCGSWTRKHAARDLYTKPETEVVAICKGTVLEVKDFYSKTDQVTVLHETNDGRKFIVRYGELAPNSISVKKDDPVVQKQKLGVTGKLLKDDGTPLLVRDGHTVYMLHFELFSGTSGYNIDIPLSNCEPSFARRSDLIEPLEILREGYINTFNEVTQNNGDRVDPNTLHFSQNGLNFLKGYETEIKKDGKHVYFDDGYGYCTIGYGHLIAGKNSCENITIPDNFKNGLTDAEADALLFQDVQRISNLVKSKVTVYLYQHEFDALVSLAFNVEVSIGPESTLLRLLNTSDYDGAANEFKNWRIAGGVVSPGLVKRRAQETDIFKNNIYDSTH